MASNMCFKGFFCSPLYFSTASIFKSLFWNSRPNKRLNLSIEILFSANSVELQGLQRISRENIVFGHLSWLNSRAGTKALHGLFAGEKRGKARASAWWQRSAKVSQLLLIFWSFSHRPLKGWTLRLFLLLWGFGEGWEGVGGLRGHHIWIAFCHNWAKEMEPFKCLTP